MLTLLLYLVLTVAVMWKGLFTGGYSIAAHASGLDPTGFIWDLDWMPFALGHHLNPLVTNYADYPSGINLMWNNAIIFPALVLAPITLLFGALTSYNVLTVLAFALSCWCAFLAIRRYALRWLPALIGGLLYGFSPFMWQLGQNNPPLSLAPFPPLVVLLADEILVRQRRSPVVIGVLLGLLTAAQLLTGEEILAITLVMVIPALATLAILYRHEIRRRIGYAIEASGWALLTFLVLAAYPLYVQFFGPERIQGPIHASDTFAAPFASIIMPDANQLLGKLGVLGPTTIAYAYVGIPLLVLALISLIWLRKRGVIIVAAATTIAAIVLSYGQHVSPSAALPLPSTLIRLLPLLGNVQGDRITVIEYLGLAILVAIFLDTTLGRRLWWKLGGSALILVALAPVVPSVPFPTLSWRIPAFFTDGSAGRLRAGGSVLLSPYRDASSVVWWARSDLAFRAQLSTAITQTAQGPDVGALDQFDWYLYEYGELGKPTVNFHAKQRTECIQDLRYHDVTTIIVGPSKGEAEVIRFVTDLLGRPGTSVGGVVVWYGVNMELPHLPASAPLWETSGDPPLNG
jgi:hypothetical protein